MNFLNKKFTPANSLRQLNSHTTNNCNILPTNQRSFIPPSRQILATGQIHCESHSSEIIRHLCFDCLQALCSQCISEHLSAHREKNIFPSIVTIKQARQQMGKKLQFLIDNIAIHSSQPIDVNKEKRLINGKIENVKKRLIISIEQWAKNLKQSLINSIQIQQITCIQDQILKLREQIKDLKNTFTNSNNLHNIKKVFQIDAEKLLKAYDDMNKKCCELKHRSECSIQFNFQKFYENLQSNLKINKPASQLSYSSHQSIIDSHVQIVQPPYMNNIQNKNINLNLIQEKSKDASTLNVAKIKPNEKLSKYLFEIIPGGHQTSKVYIKNFPGFHQYVGQLINPVYPLFAAINTENILIISGGIIKEDQKSKQINVYQIKRKGKQQITISLQQTLQMKHGRSSHSMVYDKNSRLVYIIGGFNDEGQQNIVEVFELRSNSEIKVLSNQYKWGGACLSAIVRNKIIKITVQGIQVLDLKQKDGEWQQVNNDLDFTLAKGMTISYIPELNQIIICGNSVNYACLYLLQNNEMEIKVKGMNGQNYHMSIGNSICSLVDKQKLYLLTNKGLFEYNHQSGFKQIGNH